MGIVQEADSREFVAEMLIFVGPVLDGGPENYIVFAFRTRWYELLGCSTARTEQTRTSSIVACAVEISMCCSVFLLQKLLPGLQQALNKVLQYSSS